MTLCTRKIALRSKVMFVIKPTKDAMHNCTIVAVSGRLNIQQNLITCVISHFINCKNMLYAILLIAKTQIKALNKYFIYGTKGQPVMQHI